MQKKLYKITHEKKIIYKTYLDSFIGLRRNGDVKERLDEVVEFGSEPDPVDEIGVVGGGSGGLGGGGGRRKVGEDGGEEGLDREEGFKGVLRRRRGGNVGEESREVVDVGSGGEKLVA